jgi:hypothetical protein
VRLDPILLEQPAEHLGRAIGAVAEKPVGIRVERTSRRSIMRFAANTSACRIAVFAATSTMIAFSTSIR